MRIKLVTQKCLIQNRGYYITEMYGLDDMTKEDAEKECVICMSNPCAVVRNALTHCDCQRIGVPCVGNR